MARAPKCSNRRASCAAGTAWYMSCYGAHRKPAASISRLVLTGGGSRLTGLAERLQTSTRIPVVSGNPIERLTMGKTGLTPEQLTFVQPLAVVPVGLALGAV